MGPLSGTVILLAAATLVVGTPFVNKLQPGQEFPTRNSVKQPSDNNVPEKLEDIVTKVSVVELPNLGESPAVAQVVKDINKKESATITDADDESSDLQPEAIVVKAIDGKNSEEKVDYTGAQVWKVSTSETGVKDILYGLQGRHLISTWAGNDSYVDVLVKPDAMANVTKEFQYENIKYTVIIENLQKIIDKENPPLDDSEAELQDRKGHRMNWKQYHRLEDIYGFMDYLAKTYPAIVSVKEIGKSHEGRDIRVLRISDGKPTNKAVFIDGGIHAREWISPATVTYFMNQFAENFDIESDDIKNIDWYFVPVLNPDGYEYTHVGDRLWRKNRRFASDGWNCGGIDLNRNFGYRWGGKGTSANPCSEIYRGPKAFSEPESKAIADFITSSAANFSVYLTYHSYGQYILYPWGYENAVPPDYKDLDALGRKMSAAIETKSGDRYQVGSSSKLLYPAAGGSDDWAKAQGIKYAYTIELSDTGRYGFVLPTTYIEPVAQSSLAAVRVMAAQINKE